MLYVLQIWSKNKACWQKQIGDFCAKTNSEHFWSMFLFTDVAWSAVVSKTFWRFRFIICFQHLQFSIKLPSWHCNWLESNRFKMLVLVTPYFYGGLESISSKTNLLTHTDLQAPPLIPFLTFIYLTFPLTDPPDLTIQNHRCQFTVANPPIFWMWVEMGGEDDDDTGPLATTESWEHATPEVRIKPEP